jgi:glycosyltransferase involved in cell wall biosynthesis
MPVQEKITFPTQCNSSENNNAQDEQIYNYQISELHKEIEYLQGQLSLVPIPVQLICKKLKELWWTITAIIGLGWLHDGTRVKPMTEANEPTVTLPTIAYDNMPSPRLFLDVTATYKTNIRTGVQRVIREICRHGEKQGALAPIIIHENQFVSVPDLNPLKFKDSDQILLLDSGWTNTENYTPALKLAKSQGANIILGVYDLIPHQYRGFVHPHFSFLFDNWLTTITPFCSRALAISHYSADCFLTWAKDNSSANYIKKVGWFHLGADIAHDSKLAGAQIENTASIPSSFYLSIGTLEPRKGYSISLDAFDLLWSKGSSKKYVIIGRKGDLGAHVINRIINHKEFGKKLFWPQNVNDKLLELYYRNCCAVIIPTVAEGFGLPLIETSFYQKSIIASDLQVFREIVPEGVIFFPITDSSKLAEAIDSCSREADEPARINALSWSDATQKLIDLIKNDTYQINI